MKLANENGITVIRIYQPDVWNDKNNWKSQLLDSIKIYIRSGNIFIGDIYDQCYDKEFSMIPIELIPSIKEDVKLNLSPIEKLMNSLSVMNIC